MDAYEEPVMTVDCCELPGALFFVLGLLLICYLSD
jgi:hypothetical protein